MLSMLIALTLLAPTAPDEQPFHFQWGATGGLMPVDSFSNLSPTVSARAAVRSRVGLSVGGVTSVAFVPPDAASASWHSLLSPGFEGRFTLSDHRLFDWWVGRQMTLNIGLVADRSADAWIGGGASVGFDVWAFEKFALSLGVQYRACDVRSPGTQACIGSASLNLGIAGR